MEAKCYRAIRRVQEAIFIQSFLYLLSFILENLDHVLVATNELAASVQPSGVRETAFLHDLSRCGIAGEMICPDVFEMLHLDAVVDHQFQCFGADPSVPIWLSYPIANLTVVFSDRDIAGFLGVVAHAADSLTSLFQDNCPCRVIMEECPDDLPTFFNRLMHRPSGTWPYVRV